MTTLILGAHGPLGLACVRAALRDGARVLAAVQAPHKLPPALDDLRDEHPTQLESVHWQPGRWTPRTGITRALITELPIAPAQADEPDDALAALRDAVPDGVLHDARTVLPPTLAALQVIAMEKPVRVLIQSSWLGSVEEKIRGGAYGVSVGYAAHLMLARAAALDLSRAGVAAVVGNAGRHRLDLAGPEFHADVDDVARGLLAVLDATPAGAEPEFRDWRGTLRRW